jgi:hypothetical protein
MSGREIGWPCVVVSKVSAFARHPGGLVLLIVS